MWFAEYLYTAVKFNEILLGINFMGQQLKIRRPRDYQPISASFDMASRMPGLLNSATRVCVCDFLVTVGWMTSYELKAALELSGYH